MFGIVTVKQCIVLVEPTHHSCTIWTQCLTKLYWLASSRSIVLYLLLGGKYSFSRVNKNDWNVDSKSQMNIKCKILHSITRYSTHIECAKLQPTVSVSTYCTNALAGRLQGSEPLKLSACLFVYLSAFYLCRWFWYWCSYSSTT